MQRRGRQGRVLCCNEFDVLQRQSMQSMKKATRAARAVRKPPGRWRRRWLAAAVLVPAGAVVYGLSALPPLVAAHRWSVAVSADEVFDQYSDLAGHAQWRRDLNRVEVAEREGAYPNFIEYRHHGQARCEVKEADFPWRLAWLCQVPGGSEHWQLTLQPEAAGTMVELSRRLELDLRQLQAWAWRWHSADLADLATDLSERL